METADYRVDAEEETGLGRVVLISVDKRVLMFSRTMFWSDSEDFSSSRRAIFGYRKIWMIVRAQLERRQVPLELSS